MMMGAGDTKSSILGGHSMQTESRLGRTASLMRHLNQESTDTFLSATTLTDIEGLELPIHIGITTGQIFQAIVGDDNSNANRLDIALIGDAYHRAQNILGFAQQQFGKIYVDYATMS